MNPIDSVAGFVCWNVAFAEARSPSVSLITEQGEQGTDTATLVVCPHGIDQYPKYLVRFNKVLAALCYEESLALERGYPRCSDTHASGCAYLWADSPWLRASHGWAVDFLQWSDLKHYLIFGGDTIVEILAAGGSNVERIEKRTVIETKHEI